MFKCPRFHYAAPPVVELTAFSSPLGLGVHPHPGCQRRRRDGSSELFNSVLSSRQTTCDKPSPAAGSIFIASYSRPCHHGGFDSLPREYRLRQQNYLATTLYASARFALESSFTTTPPPAKLTARVREEQPLQPHHHHHQGPSAQRPTLPQLPVETRR